MTRFTLYPNKQQKSVIQFIIIDDWSGHDDVVDVFNKKHYVCKEINHCAAGSNLQFVS